MDVWAIDRANASWTVSGALRIVTVRMVGVSASIVALVEGVLMTLYLTKLKRVAAWVVAGLTLSIAASLVLLPEQVIGGDDRAMLVPSAGCETIGHILGEHAHGVSAFGSDASVVDALEVQFRPELFGQTSGASSGEAVLPLRLR